MKEKINQKNCNLETCCAGLLVLLCDTHLPSLTLDWIPVNILLSSQCSLTWTSARNSTCHFFYAALLYVKLMTRPPSRTLNVIATFDIFFFPLLFWREPQAEPLGPFLLPLKGCRSRVYFLLLPDTRYTDWGRRKKHQRARYVTYITIPVVTPQTSPLSSK